MLIVKIEPYENGAHDNQTSETIFEGWAVIPDELETENFPFGEIEVEEIDGVLTVTNWVASPIPEPDPDPIPEPTLQDDMDAMMIDHELRITMLELGISAE